MLIPIHSNCASALSALSKQPSNPTVVQQIDEAKLIEHMDQKYVAVSVAMYVYMYVYIASMNIFV
ncbi:hypothetical protein EON65_03855 [archaeon]|nr:MAG: hypothetical protein EON65_03855 [archaeon]